MSKEAMKLAREAGFNQINESVKEWNCFDDEIHRFAELVRAEEREVCAKVCDDLNFIDNGTPAGTRTTNRHCAAAIRARSNT